MSNKYYKYKKPLDQDPKRAVILQLASSNNYYLRIRRKDKRGYFQKSLGTSNITRALVKAEQLWEEFRVNEAAGIKTTSRRNFNRLFSKFLDEYNFAPQRHKKILNNFKRYYSEFFAKYSVTEVNSRLMQEYMVWRRNYWVRRRDAGEPVPSNYSFDPSPVTLRGEKNEIVQFLNWCALHSYLPHAVKIHLPSLSNRNIEKSMRYKRWGNRADQSQLNLFQKKLREHFGQSKTFRDELCVRRLYYFIAIVRNCNIRPGTEATRLLWSDLDFKPSNRKKGQHIPILNIRSGKVGPRYAVGALGSEKYFYEWRIWLQKGCREEWGIDQSYGEDYDHIFPHYLGGPCRPTLINLAFKRYLRKFTYADDTPMEYNKAGHPISLYSIRSSEINKMITDTQWPVGKIAAAFGTSVAQISAAYAQEFIKVYAEKYANKDGPNAKDWNLGYKKLKTLEEQRQLLEALRDRDVLMESVEDV